MGCEVGGVRGANPPLAIPHPGRWRGGTHSRVYQTLNLCGEPPSKPGTQETLAPWGTDATDTLETTWGLVPSEGVRGPEDGGKLKEAPQHS